MYINLFIVGENGLLKLSALSKL